MIRSIEYKIKEYLWYLGKTNGNLVDFLKIHKNWQAIIGNTISKICTPSFLNKKILTLTVVDSSWAYEINMQRLVIIKKIESITHLKIENIKTVIGSVESEVESKEDEQDIYLSDSEIEYINNTTKTLDNLNDDKLKEVFKKLISKSIKQEKSYEASSDNR